MSDLSLRHGLMLICILAINVNGKLRDDVCVTPFWKNGKVTVDMMKASSHGDDRNKSRIDCCSGSINGGWCGDKKGNNWLEINFPQPVGFRRIIIRQPEDSKKGYIKTFNLQFMLPSQNRWINYGNNPNAATNIPGLNSSLHQQTVSLTGIVISKLKINIVSFEGEPCLRFDILGCSTPTDLCPNGCLNGGSCIQEETCACTSGYSGKRCEQLNRPTGSCKNPLGMENRSIPDEMLTVSSSAPGKGKEKARHGCCNGEHVGAWCPATTDKNPFYQVELRKAQAIHTISFQHPGRLSPVETPDTYMETFRLDFVSPLDPEAKWRTFAENIPSIYNSSIAYDITLKPSIVTDKIRIVPMMSKNQPCFRFELLGCEPTALCPAGWCQHGGTCMGENTCKCIQGYYGDRCENKVDTISKYIIQFKKITQTTITTTSSIVFQIHGNVQLQTENNKNILHISGNNSYTTIQNSNFSSCLIDTDSCTSGFTISLNVNFQKITDNTYIISNGGNLKNHKGFSLYYKQKMLYCVVTTSTQTWQLQIPFSVHLNVWQNFELSWSKALGLELYNNHHLIGSVFKPIQTVASLTKQIAIGFGYTQTTNVNLKVEGLKTYDSSRSELVRGGIVNTVGTTVMSTTVSDKPVPTTSTGIKNFNFTFMGIIGNVLITPTFNFTVHGHPALRPEPDGTVILILNKTGQYVELPNKGLECVQDMTKCDHGFTLQVEVKLLETVSTNKLYIFSSGGDKVNSSGIALYIWHNELYCSTKKDRIIWAAKKMVNFDLTVWHKYQVSWNKQDGFIVYVDGQHFMDHSTKLPNPDQPNIHPLLIANSFNATQTTKMEIKNLYTWTASRDVLITQGIITEYPTTAAPSTTVITTKGTTKTVQTNGIKTLNFTFIQIILNVLLTPSMNFSVFGKPVLIPNSQNGLTLVLNKTGQYIELPNNGLECLVDITKCQKGFTLKAEIKLLKQEFKNKRLYIYSSGGDSPGTSGIALFIENNRLKCWARSLGEVWTNTKLLTFDVKHWHTYQISWNPKDGFYVYVDGKLFMKPDIHLNTGLQVGIHSLLIGGSFTTNVTTLMEIKNLYTWTASRDILIQQGVIKEYTTPAPTVPTTPYVKQTSCGKSPVDIVFLIDESSSIGNRNFAVVKNFVKNIITDLMTDSGKYIQIGLVTFSNDPVNRFWLNQFTNMDDMNKVIDAIKYGKRGTDIAKGLKLVRENSFSREHGAREGASKIMILLTDGYSHNTDSEAQKVHDAGITAMVIGVTSQINKKQLQKIASKPEYLNSVNDFAGLDTIKQKFLKEIPCEPEIPKYEWNFTTSISHSIVIGSKFNLTVTGSIKQNISNGIEITSSSQHIDFGSHLDLCLGNLSLCYHGITIQITVLFMKLEENTVIMTSGGEKPDGTGIALIYRYGKVQCVVSNSTVSWYATISRERLSLFYTHTIIISWSNIHGLQVIVDNHLVQHTTSFVEHHKITTSPEHLYIGSPITSSSTQIDYFVKTVTIWHIWIGIIIDVGEIAPPIDEKTTTAATTKAVTTTSKPKQTTEYCKAGWVCKDNITTKKPTTQKPTTRKPSTTRTTPTTTTTKPKPVKPNTPTKPVISPGVDSHGSAHFTCKFVKSKQPNVEYIVSINVNDVTITSQTVSGNQETVQFTVSQINEFLYNKKVTCSIKARFVGQSIVTTVVTSKVFIPTFKLVSTGKIVLTEGRQPQSIQVSVNGPPQMFCCKGCKGNCQVHIVTHANYDRHYTKCSGISIPQVLVGWKGEIQSGKAEQCGVSIRPMVWNKILEIPITANADGLYDRDHTGYFSVKAHILDIPQPMRPGYVATPHTLNIGKVTVQAKNNDHRSTCKSLNDPHITTFDNKRYDNFNEGEFILYRHKTLPFEIRAKYSRCTTNTHRHGHHHNSRATCNCAVAIKSGDDVITFTSCGNQKSQVWNRHFHGKTPITVEMYKNGELTPGTLIRRIGCGQKYEVRLPTGSLITIQSSYLSFMNIWIRPSSLDFHQTEGLCGIYDRNPNNDVVDGNGHPVPGKNPDRFSLMWRAKLTIFMGVSASPLTGISTFCSCVDTKSTFCRGSYGSMQCWDPRYDITKTVVRQAKVPRHGRQKRQAEPSNNVDLPQDNNTVVMEYGAAVNKCEDYIRKSPATQSCQKYLDHSNINSNFTERIESCATDLQLTGDEEWARGHVRDIVQECLTEVESTPTSGNNTNTTDTETPPVLQLSDMCLEDCGEHGTCKQGVCDCVSGYTGDYCNISSSTKPGLITTPLDGTGCDKRTTDDCKQAVIIGNNFVQSSDLTCHYQYIQVGTSVKKTRSPGTVPAVFISMTQVICPLPDIKDTNGAYIRVSNDGETESDDEYIHLVFDSTCYDCDIENMTDSSHCVRRPYTCVINGECFAANTKKSDNKCKVCDPSNLDSQWTDSEATECISEPLPVTDGETDRRNKAIITGLAVACGVLGFFLLISLICIYKLRFSNASRYPISKHPTKEFGEYNVSKKEHHYTDLKSHAMDNPVYTDKL